MVHGKPQNVMTKAAMHLMRDAAACRCRTHCQVYDNMQRMAAAAGSGGAYLYAYTPAAIQHMHTASSPARILLCCCCCAATAAAAGSKENTADAASVLDLL
jgi:hypothetical protein